MFVPLSGREYYYPQVLAFFGVEEKIMDHEVPFPMPVPPLLSTRCQDEKRRYTAWEVPPEPMICVS